MWLCNRVGFSLALVESIPQHVKYKANLTFGVPLGDVWKRLIAVATEQVDVASFYWTLTGEDINVNSSSDVPVSMSQTSEHTHLDDVAQVTRPLCPRQGKTILQDLEGLPARNVSVRVVTSVPSVRTNSTDLRMLKQKGRHRLTRLLLLLRVRRANSSASCRRLQESTSDR